MHLFVSSRVSVYVYDSVFVNVRVFVSVCMRPSVHIYSVYGRICEYL